MDALFQAQDNQASSPITRSTLRVTMRWHFSRAELLRALSGGSGCADSRTRRCFRDAGHIAVECTRINYSFVASLILDHLICYYLFFQM